MALFPKTVMLDEKVYNQLMYTKTELIECGIEKVLEISPLKYGIRISNLSNKDVVVIGLMLIREKIKTL